MIGFDRPLKPEWIYETLKMVKVGENPSVYYEPFENITRELVGKEGKRKVRTVIFRSFIFSFQKTRKIIGDNIFLNWVKEYSLKELSPLFLAKILMDYEIARFITKKVDLYFDLRNHISSPILMKKMVGEYGDRDVVKRSVRSFLKTLVHFKILEQSDRVNFRFIRKFSLSNNQVKNLILLYSTAFLKSKIVDLTCIEPTILFFFEDIDFQEVAREYHLKEWEFIRDVNRNLVLIK